ncbi:MAG TPA: hypothetical protein VF384_14620 [Planctomycetota bacterium]
MDSILRRWHPFFCLLAVSPLVSQTVRVVDPSGGGQYLTVTAAIAASLPGDTILVRGGVWAGVSIDIPLRIASAGPRPSFLQIDFRFYNARPTLPVVITGVDFMFGTIVGAGSVVLEDCTARHLGVYDTESLLVVDATATGFGIPFPGPSLDLHDTHAAVVSSTIVGWTGQPAIGVDNGSLQAADCTLTGGPGYGSTPPGPAVRGRGTRIALTRSTLAGGGTNPQVAVDVDDRSTVAVDPSVVFTGSMPQMLEKRALAHLEGAGVAAGQRASVQLSGPPRTFAFLALADRATAPAECPFGTLWLDPAGFFATVMTGTTDDTGRTTLAYTMPPLVCGTPLYFQGLVLPASAPPSLTVPLAVVVR